MINAQFEGEGTIYLMISLCSTMRLSSFTTMEPTHTEVDEIRRDRLTMGCHALSLRMSESFL